MSRFVCAKLIHSSVISFCPQDFVELSFFMIKHLLSYKYNADKYLSIQTAMPSLSFVSVI